MFCKEIALGPGWWQTGRERLCAVGAVLWNGVGTRGLTSIGMFAGRSKSGKLPKRAGLLAGETKSSL